MQKLYMWFFNYTKVGLIWIADMVSALFDPFEEREYLGPVHDIKKLETLFAADLEARFMQPTGEFCYQLPRPDDAGDTALFQGLATAYKIMKGDDVTKQIEFINTLFINGTLIRGYRSDGTPNDTTSNDSATGMIMFFYAALEWGNPDVEAKATALLRRWIDNLLTHNGALVDLQGNPTQYGALENGWLTDPLRITCYLAILALGATCRIDRAYNEYARIYELYKPILSYAKVKLLWWDTDYDTHRAAIHLHVLSAVAGKDVYDKGLKRLWNIAHKEGNAWVYILCRKALHYYDDAWLEQRLGTFDFARRQLGSVESLNPGVPSVNWPPKLPAWLGFLGATKERSKYALPMDQRGSQDFFWQRNMFSKDEWIGKNWPAPYHSGLDMLICMQMARRLGILS